MPNARLISTHNEDQLARVLDAIRPNGLVILQTYAFKLR